MGRIFNIFITAFLTALVCSARLAAQDNTPLRLVQTIPMPNVKGRIDHMDVDVKGKRLLVAGLENGSVEVVDLADRHLQRRADRRTGAEMAASQEGLSAHLDF